VLGFVWSMLNPALYLVVFYIVFQILLPNGIKFFAIYLLSGLLVWNLFSTGVTAATASVVANGSIVKKVYFPREILPLAAVGAAVVHFFLQSIVLLLALSVFRYTPSPSFLALALGALIVLLVFSSAVAVLLSAINVYLRDTQHLLELVLLAWFWMTPIVYTYGLVDHSHHDKAALMLLNPITDIVLVFQRAIYNDPHALGMPPGTHFWWYASHLLIVLAVSLILLLIGLVVFDRLSGNFAEEL